MIGAAADDGGEFPEEAAERFAGKIRRGHVASQFAYSAVYAGHRGVNVVHGSGVSEFPV